MPFPFHRLHCDLQMRLRDLLTPSELFSLQIAMGYQPNYMHPLQYCQVTHSEYGLFQINGSIQLISLADNCVVDGLALVERLEIFHDITDANVDALNAHAIFNVQTLVIGENIIINAGLLEKIASFCSKTCCHCLIVPYQIHENVDFKLIFTLFPLLRTLSMYVFTMEDWFPKLLEASCKMTELELLFITLVPTFINGKWVDLDPEYLYQFCQTRSSCFVLELIFATEDDIKPAVLEHLMPYFREVESANDVVKIKLHNGERDVYVCYNI